MNDPTELEITCGRKKRLAAGVEIARPVAIGARLLVERSHPISKIVFAAPLMDRRPAPFASEVAPRNVRCPFLRGAIDRLARHTTEIDAYLVCHRAGSLKDRVEQEDDPGDKPHERTCKEKLVTFGFGGELCDPFLVFRVQRNFLHLFAVLFHFGLLVKADGNS
jgi:hypothetical protein